MVNKWKTDSLEHLTFKIGDGLHGTPIFNDSGNYYFINGNNFQKRKIVISENDSKIKYDEAKKYLKDLNENTILISINGTIGNMAFYNNERIVLGKSACYINCNQSRILKQYLFYVLGFKKNQEILIGNTTGTTIKNLSLKSIRDYLVFYPESKKEQKIIAESLYNIDNLIDSLQLLISKKINIRDGFLHLYFNKLNRLDGYEKEWIKIKINEISKEIIKGSGLSKEDVDQDGKSKCILYGELFTKYNENINKVVSKTNIEIGVKSRNGDILIPGSTTTVGRDLAKACLINEDNVLLGGDINIIRLKDNMYPLFISYLFSNCLNSQVEKVAQGTTIIHLHGKNIGKISINIPRDYNEQKQLADTVLKMDCEIEALKEKLSKYNKIKDGMMEDLLTGKVRLSYE